MVPVHGRRPGTPVSSTFAYLRNYAIVMPMVKANKMTCAAPLGSLMQPDLFRALGDPTRLTLLLRLAAAERPLTVNEVSDCCGVHLSGVSRHLAILRDAGVIVADRQGREVLHRIDAASLANSLRQMASALENCCPSSNPNLVMILAILS